MNKCGQFCARWFPAAQRDERTVRNQVQGTRVTFSRSACALGWLPIADEGEGLSNIFVSSLRVPELARIYHF